MATAWLQSNMQDEDQVHIATPHWADQMVPSIGRLKPDTVSANFIDRVLRGAVQMGASRPKLLAAIHLQNASLRNPIGRASRTVLINLFAAMERDFGDPAIGMRIAAAAKPACFSDLGYVAFFAPTVAEMLKTTLDIQGHRQNIWTANLDLKPNPARLTWTLPDDNPDYLHACLEFSVASYAHLYRSALPTRMAPQLLRLGHQPRFDVALYEELVGCPVIFGAEQTSLEFSRSQFALSLPTANPELQQRVQANYAKAVDWLVAGRKYSALCYLYLASELNKSPLKLERVAASFGLSERTLRRKLVEEGLPFRKLLENVRRDLSDLYRLEGRRTISEIAELLGYSELSAFTRAHNNWHGVPPRQALHS